jgi:hypothetical protein
VKARYVIMLGAVLLLVSSASAQAQGYCMKSSFCNDIYIEIGSGVAIQTLAGYEYGCSPYPKDRQYNGTIRIVGSTAYLNLTGNYGLSGVSGTSPAGALSTVTAAVNVSTGLTTWAYWQYFHAYAGSVNTTYGPDTYTVTTCSPPAGPQRGAPSRPDKFELR